MARRKGIVNVSTDYEVKIKAPFDARQLCNTKDDLINEDSWSYASTYVGMLVSVANDPVADNNGVYFLKVDTPTDESSWVKLFDTEEFEAWKKELPELPKERLARFMEMTGIAEDEAEVLVSSRTMADFFEEAANKANPKKVANYILGPMLREIS